MFITICLSNSCKESTQNNIPQSNKSSNNYPQSNKPRRNNSENMELIHASDPKNLNQDIKQVVQIVEKLFSFENGKKDAGSSTHFVFNSKKQLTKEQVYDDAKKLMESTTYEYDITGNLISKIATNHDGGSGVAINFIYNKSGQLTNSKTTLSQHKTEIYKYDDMNYLIETKILDNLDSLWETTYYSYNEKGILSSIITKSNKGETTSVDSYLYNNLNQCIQEEHSGQPINCAGRNKWQKKYNEFGDIIEEKTHDLTVKYKYEYDKKKNWTRQFSYYNAESAPNFLIERAITYTK